MGQESTQTGLWGSSRFPAPVVENKIEVLGGRYGYRARVPEAIDRIVVHRIDVGDSAYDVAEFFRRADNLHYTSGKYPYHLTFHKDGRVLQVVELGFQAPAARVLNKPGIQIALIGDFRKEPPTVKQGLALVELCVALCEWMQCINIMAHDEESDASADPDKECPGKHLPIKNLREIVEMRYNMVDGIDAEKHLLSMGVTI